MVGRSVINHDHLARNTLFRQGGEHQSEAIGLVQGSDDDTAIHRYYPPNAPIPGCSAKGEVLPAAVGQGSDGVRSPIGGRARTFWASGLPSIGFQQGSVPGAGRDL